MCNEEQARKDREDVDDEGSAGNEKIRKRKMKKGEGKRERK